MFVFALAAIACDHQKIENASFSIGDLVPESSDLAKNGVLVAVGSYDSNTKKEGTVVVRSKNTSQWHNITLQSNGGFGAAISLAENASVLAVGSPRFQDKTVGYAGLVNVYSCNITDCIEKGNPIQGKISDREQYVGYALKLSDDGNTLAVGSPSLYNGGAKYKPRVRVYDWNSTTWVERKRFIEFTDNTPYESGLGKMRLHMNHDATVIAIGKSLIYSKIKGKVEVYEWNTSAWIQRGNQLSGQENTDAFGYSVALSKDGSLLAVGAPYYSNRKGSVTVYEWKEDQWSQIGNPIIGKNKYDECGTSVAFANNTLAVGCPKARINSVEGAGYAQVYNRYGNDWVERGNLIEGSRAFSFCGITLSLSRDGSTLALNSYDEIVLYDLCTPAPAPAPKTRVANVSGFHSHSMPPRSVYRGAPDRHSCITRIKISCIRKKPQS